MSIAKTNYGIMPSGEEVFAYEIKNNLVTASIVTLGAALNKLLVKDKSGNFRDVLLGFDNLHDRLSYSDYHGVTVGQYCNRIKGGKFMLCGKLFNVEKNENNITCLHGAGEYSSALWKAKEIDDKSVCFTYLSPDMNNGFPGSVENRVTYTLSESDLIIEYDAVPDTETIINLTNHAYFNLNGYDFGTILNHTLTINADYYIPIDKYSIPTGDIASVKGTPLSFVDGKKIGKEIDADAVQLKNGQGYDHNFCINGYDGTLKTAAKVKGDESGIELTVKTTLPGIQFYSGNFLNGMKGKNNISMERRTGFCLETQFYPDTPNNAHFPPCVFSPEKPYKSKTVYSFSNI